jgi:hypothetical protein
MKTLKRQISVTTIPDKGASLARPRLFLEALELW